ANAQILDEDVRTDRVSLGSRVTIVEDGGAPETYQIVGVAEADPAAGRISYESPLGKALMGRRVGEVVEAMTPGGILRFRIVSLNLPS
ncbi:MAG: GreA/GreB family elongation factor, partial [Chloroflexi bacterium]|nr:GreA/GreB family elongation factor [Chloroflexota bacterium]